jgi:hypothetical protein
MKYAKLLIISLLLIGAAVADSEIFDIRMSQADDGSGLVRICFRARNTTDTVLAVNVQARWADSTDWHIPVVTLWDTISEFASVKPNYGWRCSADSVGIEHCIIWDMTTDLGPVEADDFLGRIVTFDSLVSSFAVIDSFLVRDTLRPEVRAFGLCYKRGQLWVLYHNEWTHDCWIRPYDLPEIIEGDSIHIGTVTVGPSDMAFAGDRLFWVEDTRLLLKEFDFATGTSHTVRGDWWGLPGTEVHIAGAAFDGQHLWVCFSRGAFVALDTSDFSLVDTMFFPVFGISEPATSADGLAWGLGLLWCYSNDNIAYGIDVDMDSIIHAVPTGEVVEMTGAEGAAWDGMNLWVVDYGRGYVYKLLLFNQIKLYLSDPFKLDNIPPRVEWITPSAPDYSDTFLTSSLAELLWSAEDLNLAGGFSTIWLGLDTIGEIASTDTSLFWDTYPWPGFRSHFDLAISDSFGNKTAYLSPYFAISEPDGIDDRELPGDFTLSAHPNPFNSAVTIAIEGVGDGSPVPFDVEIYDVNGRKIDVIARRAEPNEAISPNNRSSVPLDTRRDAVSINNCEFVWQPHESLPSGVYLVRARVGGRGDLAPTGQATTKRIVYLK